MSIRLELPKVTELKPRIAVIGVGGAGGNAVNNMIAAGLYGVEFIVANTDAQALASSSAEMRIQLGSNLTEGLGAGSKPEIGEAAAEEAADEIRGQIAGSHMVFIAAGMGGGTGTGAAGVIARIAKELGILVVAIVTKPFQFEGARRMRMAEAGIAALRSNVDTMIVIPNQNLFRVATERTTFAEAFVLADQVLYSGIACIVDLIVKEGLINLDFADVRTVLSEMGSAVMGTGEASGERRAVLAAEEAISNPLLDDISLQGARGLLLSIIGGKNLTLYEVDEAASRVRQEVDPEANIIVGATFDDTLQDRVRVSIVASGMEARPMAAPGKVIASAAPPGRLVATEARSPEVAPADSMTSAARTQSQASAAPQSSTLPPPPPPLPPPPPAPGPSAGGPVRRFDELPLSQPVSQAPAAAPAPALRGPSQREADDYARAMTAAYDHPTPPPADPSVWENDGVTIEEAMAPLGKSSPSPTPPPLPRSPRTEPASASAPAFHAHPPADLRRPPRRMPELADFPEVAQRDYRAKAPATGERGSLPAPSAGRPGAETATRRKQGLFERLSSFARRESDADDVATELAGRTDRAGSKGHAQPGHGSHRGGADDPDSRATPTAQQPDLPDFFDRRRR